MVRLFAGIGGLLLPGLLGLVGCQAVVDFDEDRICKNSDGQELDCRLRSIAGPDVVFDCVLEGCNPETGRCEYPPDPEADGQACDDGDPCTDNTVCDDGLCVGGTQSPDGTECVSNPCQPGTCQAGECVLDPQPPGTPCTPETVCQGDGECTQTGDQEPVCIGPPQNDFDDCEDDGDPCTANTCFNSDCLASPVNCDDRDPCTVDSCDGGCVNTPVECPPGEVCDSEDGSCVPE